MPTADRYEIERELGAGAMGVVYLARDTRLGRHIALKAIRLPDGLSPATRDEFRERFLREARAAAALSHPGIVTIYDAGHDERSDTSYITMEYVEGRSLRALLDTEGRLAPEQAASLAGRVAEALGAAHRAGIVHRDVKPANLLVRDADGAIKVADFGVARLPASELTRTDVPVGSPAYMSPEQIRGRAVDCRSDLFSLAVVLYEALCGERPFAGQEVSEIVYAVVHETPVPITRRVAGLPLGFDTFFDRALAKEADARFADATAFREALARTVTSTAPVPAGERTWIAEEPVPVARPGRRMRGFAAVGLVLLVALAWAIFGREGAHLQLDARSTFQDATLQLLIDGEEAFERDLEAPPPPSGTLGKVKRLLPGRHETFEAWLEVDPGKHEIAARVRPAGSAEPLADVIAVDLDPGEKRRLRLVAEETRYGGTVSLKLD